MAEAAFGVTYDGPALATGRMPVRDLAPALLSLGELFADASVLLHPDRKPVALDIKATREGSFVIDLILESERAWDQLVDIFGSDAASALANLKDLIIGGGVGLFWLIKRLRGRGIARQENVPESGQIRLTLDDGTTLEIPSEVLSLYGNISVRKKARKVVEPLAREGVESLEFRSDEIVTVVVEKDDLSAYEVPAGPDVPLLEQEIEMVVAIASVAFTEGNKWRLTDGERTFHAAVEDEAFLARVDDGIEAFRKGDMLRCRMRVVQTQSPEGLKTEYHVTEVVEHIPRPTQLQLGDQGA